MGTFIHDFVKGECVTQVRAIGPQSDTIQPFTVVNLDVCPRDVHDISDAITLYTNQSLVEGNFPFTSRQQYAAKCVLAERSGHTLCCWLIIAVNVAENLSSLAFVAVGYVCLFIWPWHWPQHFGLHIIHDRILRLCHIASHSVLRRRNDCETSKTPQSMLGFWVNKLIDSISRPVVEIF